MACSTELTRLPFACTQILQQSHSPWQQPECVLAQGQGEGIIRVASRDLIRRFLHTVFHTAVPQCPRLQKATGGVPKAELPMHWKPCGQIQSCLKTTLFLYSYRRTCCPQLATVRFEINAELEGRLPILLSMLLTPARRRSGELLPMLSSIWPISEYAFWLFD